MNIERAISATRAAYVCGVISTLLTLLFTLLALSQGGLNFGAIDFSLWTFVDVALMAGFTVGLYFKSRTCAILMLVYFTFTKCVQVSRGVNFFSIITGALFLYYYVQGVRGTLAYHRLKEKEANHRSEPTAPSGLGSP